MNSKCPFCGSGEETHECPYSFKWVEDYLQLPRNPYKWVVQDLVPTSGLVNIYAAPKVGKTFIFQGIAQAICNGDDEWEGFEIFQPGNVAFLQIDTPREEFADRLSKQVFNKGRFAVADMSMVPIYPFDIMNETCYKWLKQEIGRINPVMTVIDTLRDAHGEDENLSTPMRNVLVRFIAACHPSSIVLISHKRKDGNNLFNPGAESDIMEENRGTNAVAGKADMVIRLTAKRLTYKGRATGQHSLPIYQDENGFIHIKHEDDENVKMAQDLVKLHPGESTNSLAQRMCKMLDNKISMSTATRRIREAKK